MNKINKKLILIIIFLIIFMFLGGTLALWQLEFSENTRTNVSFLVEGDFFTCLADGGEPIVPSAVELLPTSCSGDNVLKREITTNVEVDSLSADEYVTLEMWLTVNEISLSLSESQYFKYVVTTSSSSCTSGIVGGGTFNGKTSSDTVLLFSEQFSSSSEDKYYLYIWLDEEEINPNTANQSFNLSLGGTCFSE